MMDHALIERLAEECDVLEDGGLKFPGVHLNDLYRFASLVAEECAKVCDELDYPGNPIARAIRERFSVSNIQQSNDPAPGKN